MDQRASVGDDANHLKLRFQQTLACVCQEPMIIGNENAGGGFLFFHRGSPEERFLNAARETR
jgi:hypothetical protein